jgi:two-component system, OmpR family, KDP operon response regulator KdpE
MTPSVSPAAAPPDGVLIVDDDPSIRSALHTTLRMLGYNTCEASDAEEALARVREHPQDVVLLDMNMPGMNGLEACRKLRMLMPRSIIVMLTVRDGLEDKVQALEAGADDYLTKPFHLRELTARIRAALRRRELMQENQGGISRVGDIELDPARREVHKAGRLIHLTRKEFDLVHLLMSHAGLPLSHERLLTAVWGPESSHEVEYLRTFVRQLRKKIEDDPANPAYLLTDIQVGYRFRKKDAGEREPSAESTSRPDPLLQ